MTSIVIDSLPETYRDTQDGLSMIDNIKTGLSIDPRLIPGSVASILSVCVAQPFEVAKVKQQTHRPALHTSHPGVLSILRTVVSKEGIRGAYAGLAPTVLMSIPNYALYLTSYDEVVAYLRRQSESSDAHVATLGLSDPAVPFVGGAIARLIATTAIAPLELLRTRQASSRLNNVPEKRPASSRVWNELHAILKKDGVKALYKGLVPSLWRDVPFAAIYMLCLDRLRDVSRQLFFDVTDGPTISVKKQASFELSNAALAGMVAASFTAPLDVVKTRLQSVPPSGRPVVAQSTVKVLRSIVSKEGTLGLWRGNQARMMKVAPQYAIMISFYEVGKKILM